MKNRLQQLFANTKKPLLSVFYTAGFPKLDDTSLIAASLEKAGADLVEIGIPFSDPVADGPTIQQSNKVALENGITLPLILQQVREIRKAVNIPIILMGYLNPVMQYGVERFAKDAGAAGVDGVILPDMPLAEYERDYRKAFDDNGLLLTFLISPTTSEERIRKIDQLSSGFIYAVSASSTTGAKSGFAPAQMEYFERLKKMKLKNPFLIGFGISNNDTFKQASQFGAGAIVGSAFVNMLKDSKDIGKDVEVFVKELIS
ncbi:MAG TPA: tryptophan synthase subunit alpha [Cyclobacteriaceae bacterium]|nr:tryptophan synthase subunit alpha [Cyclobacteriaceae bacterium]